MYAMTPKKIDFQRVALKTGHIKKIPPSLLRFHTEVIMIHSYFTLHVVADDFSWFFVGFNSVSSCVYLQSSTMFIFVNSLGRWLGSFQGSRQQLPTGATPVINKWNQQRLTTWHSHMRRIMHLWTLWCLQVSANFKLVTYLLGGLEHVYLSISWE